MKKFKFYFLLIIGLIIIESCKKVKAPIQNEQPYELNPKTIIVNESTENILTAIDSTSLKFNGNSAQLENLKVGDILVSDATNLATYGYLRKITGITKNGTITNVITENAAITEAVKSGSGRFKKTISSSDILLEDTVGAELMKTTQTTGLSFVFKKSFDLDNNTSTTNDKIEFSGDIVLNPTLQYDVDVNEYSLEHFLAKFTFSNTAKLKVKYELSIDQIGLHKTFVLKTVKLKPLTLWIGNFPLVLDQRLVFVVGIDGSVSAELVGEVNNNYTSELGLEYYKNIGWSNIKNQTNNLDGNLELSGEASLEGWLQPRYEIRAYGLNAAKVFLAAKASLKAETIINNPTTLYASLKYIGRFFGKAQMRVFSVSLVDYEQEFWSTEQTIWSDSIDYSPKDITTGLVAYYPFNGNSNDESGYGNNGTLYGGAYDTDRKNNTLSKAVKFTGSQYIEINNSISLMSPSANGKLTISAWIKVSNWVVNPVGSGYAVILSKSFTGNSTAEYFSAITENGTIYGGGTSTYPFNLNQWHHIVQTAERIGSDLITKVYVNGVLTGQSTNDSYLLGVNYLTSQSNSLFIGKDPVGYTEYCDGLIDDVRIYNRVLNSDEIQALYNE